MSVAKNKFQEIFETSSQEIAELHHNQRESLGKGATAHLASINSLQQSSTEELQKQAEDSKAEIVTRVQQSLENINKAIAIETTKIFRHTEVLIDRLSSLAQDLEQPIATENQEQEYTLSTLAEDLSCLAEYHFTEATSDIAKHSLTISQNLKAQNAFATHSFQQRMDHSVLEIRGEEKQITSRYLKTSLQATNAVDNHLSSLIQTLSEKCDSSTQDLANIFQEGMDGLNKQMEELVLTAEQHSTTIKQEIQQSHETYNCQLRSFSQESSATCLAELSSACEDYKTAFSTKVEKFCKDLDEYTHTTLQAMTNKSNIICTKTNDSTESLKNSLNKRIETAMSVYQNLEAIKDEVIKRIKQDILSTQTLFEESLAATVIKTNNELANSYSKAESAIKSLLDSSELEVKSTAGKAKSQIELTVLAFLDRVKQRRDAAIEAIQQVAASSAPGNQNKGQDKSTEGEA